MEEILNKKEEKKKDKKILDFFITTLNGMALGLFSSLIIGTIIGSIALIFKNNNETIYNIINGLGLLLQNLTGFAIGIGIALSLKFDNLKIIVLGIVGEIASYFSLSTKFVTEGISSNSFKIGDPLTIYIVVVLCALLIKYVLKKKTPVDILLIPLFGVIVGFFISLGIRYPAIYVTYGIQWIVNEGTTFTPFFMGIVVSVVMGMALTAPISSAAIAAMIFTSSEEGLLLAGGACLIGCSTQMIGFMIHARKDNNIGQIISIGIGTSMLEFKNILKKPVIWLPTIITSAILGPISTCLIKLKCAGSSAGMGTAGLVGQIGTLITMGNSWETWLIIILFEIVAPAVLVYIIDIIFRKFGWIKEGDFKI